MARKTSDSVEPKPSPPTAPPSKKVPQQQYVVALIAAAAAVVGTIGGGFAAYLGNRSLEQEQSRSAATGVARVLASQLSDVHVRLTAMLNENRVFVPDRGGNVSLPLEDQKLVASNLSISEWQSVSSAISIVRLFNERRREDVDTVAAQAKDREPLSRAFRDYVTSTDEAVEAGYHALTELAVGD